MPGFTRSDAKKHNTSLTDKQADTWAKVAEKAYASCIASGKSAEECDGKAIIMANSVLKKQKSEAYAAVLDTPLGDEVIEGLRHECFSALCEEVTETREVDGQTIQITEAESYVALIEESGFGFVPTISFKHENAVIEADSTKHLVTYRALQGKSPSSDGISKNKNFYSTEVAEGLAPLLQERRKMFLDHRLIEKFGRSINELSGIVQKAWAQEGSSFVTVDIITENPNTGWIWEFIQKYPDELGVSINAFVQGRKGKINEQEVFIVEKWRYLYSLDHVADPSAGGTFVAMATEALAHPEEEEHMDETMKLLEGVLSDELEQAKKKSAFWNIGSLVTDLIRQVARADGSDEEKKKAIKALTKEFADEIEKLDPVTLFPKTSLSYYESEELSVEIKDLTMEQLILANEAVKQFVTAQNQQVEELKQQVEKQAKEVEEAKVAAEAIVTELKQKAAETEKKLQEAEEKENKRLREDKVTQKLNESEVLAKDNKHHVSEAFRSHLIFIADDDAKLTEAIADREALILEERKKTAPLPTTNGKPASKDPESGKEGSNLFENEEVLDFTSVDDLVSNLKH